MRSQLRFLGALAGVALGAALFAVAFRAGLAWWYRAAFGADHVVSVIAGLPWWMRLAVPTAGGFAAGLIARWRKSARQGVSNVMEAIVLGHLALSLKTTMSARGVVGRRHRIGDVDRPRGPADRVRRIARRGRRSSSRDPAGSDARARSRRNDRGVRGRLQHAIRCGALRLRDDHRHRHAGRAAADDDAQR